MKLSILVMLGFTLFSCDGKSNVSEMNKSGTSEANDFKRGPEKNKLTKEEALEKARTILVKQKKELAENLKVIDHGDYYTVTPDLPPFTLGGGWSVDLRSDSGEMLKIYFTE